MYELTFGEKGQTCSEKQTKARCTTKITINKFIKSRILDVLKECELSSKTQVSIQVLQWSIGPHSKALNYTGVGRENPETKLDQHTFQNNTENILH